MALKLRNAILGVSFCLTLPSTAFANPERVQAGEERLIGIVELGLGWLVLPTAQVCVERAIAGCTEGDSSLALSAWQLFRPARRFAIGAGIGLGLTPTSDAPREDPPGTEREHSRRYLTVEASGRYYFSAGPSFEFWAGVTSGLVVVSDRFESLRERATRDFIGPRGVTIRTEGFTVGAATGIAYSLSEDWWLGGALRYGSWFLPEEPERDPFGDEASLTGQNDVVSLVVSISYLSRL